MIQITPNGPRPIFQQIVDEFRKKIVTGELSPGTKLPSVRGLAMQLTINVNTVAKAYAELTREGLVETRKGLGLYVSEVRQILSLAEEQRRLDLAIDQFINEVLGLSFSAEEMTEKLQAKLNKLLEKSTQEEDS